MKPKVLITGVSGFVGSHLADYLIEEVGAEVHGIIRPRSRDEFQREDVFYHEADITDNVGLFSIVAKLRPNFLFHLAAQSYVALSWGAPEATLQSNVIGTLKVLEAVRVASPETIIHFAGSSEEYGQVAKEETPISELNPLRPLSPYGVSKAAADLLCQQYVKSYNMKVVITRAFNHTGPRRGEVFVTSNFAHQIARIEKGAEPKVSVGNLEALRDFTDVRDMVRAYWLAVEHCYPGTPYNVCSGKAYAIKDVLSILLSLSNRNVSVYSDPERMRPSDVMLLLGDCSKFHTASGWKPRIPFERTLLDLLNYWRERV